MASLLATFARTDAGYTGFTLARYALCLVDHAAGHVLRRHDAAAHHPHCSWPAARASARSARCTAGTRSARSSGVIARRPGAAAAARAQGDAHRRARRSTWASARSCCSRRAGRGRGRPPGCRRRRSPAVAAAVLAWARGRSFDRVLLCERRLSHRHRWSSPASARCSFYRDGRTATVTARGRSAAPACSRSPPTASPTPRSAGLVRRPATRPRHRCRSRSDAATQTLLPLITLAHVPQRRDRRGDRPGLGHVVAPAAREARSSRSSSPSRSSPRWSTGSRIFYPANRRAFDDPRSQLVIDDAKSYFASAHRHST